jgi:transposase InsO family protein
VPPGRSWPTYAGARSQIGRFLDDVSNFKRIHSALGYLTPKEFGAQGRSAGSECDESKLVEGIP